MKKDKTLMGVVIAVVIAVIVIGAAVVITSGGLGVGGTSGITSDAQAKSTATDVGTDISGISNTLNEIDQTLSES